MADSFTVKASIQGGAELARKFKMLGEAAAEQALILAANAGALRIQNSAKDKAPMKTRTLSRSIHTEVIESNATAVTVEIGTNVIYAAIQEFGGQITPKQAKMLHWVDEAGNDIFAHAVQIPPHPYMRPAFDEEQQNAIDTAGKVLKELIEKAAQ